MPINHKTLVSSACFVVIAFHASPAYAELVFFASGRSLSVKGHRAEGSSLVLALRGGGEIVCDASLIARIEPDEVPYPEPELGPKPDIATDRDSGGSLGLAADLRSDARYEPIIARVSAQHGVDAALVRAVIQVESAYRSRARSQKGAMGLMQLMPATARQYAVTDPYNPESNIEAGVRHLKSLLERFPLRLALAAYNAGEGAVRRFRGIPPYPETRDYVAQILKLVGRG